MIWIEEYFFDWSKTQKKTLFLITLFLMCNVCDKTSKVIVVEELFATNKTSGGDCRRTASVVFGPG